MAITHDVQYSYSRLERDEMLLVFVVHFASDDIGDIHYCEKKKEKVTAGQDVQLRWLFATSVKWPPSVKVGSSWPQ